MIEADPLATMLVGGIVGAFLLGFLAHKLRISPILGYLLAGVLIGPHTPGLAVDAELAGELADLGVILILFGAGLKFSPGRLKDYRWVAVPGALGQMIVTTALGAGIAVLFEMGWTEALIFGFSLSIASTIVLLRAVESRHQMTAPIGRLAVSWGLVQNLVAVLVLTAMPAVAAASAAEAGSGAVARAVAVKAVELGLFMLIMLVIARRILPRILVFVARAKSRELFSLGVFAIALGIAYAAHALLGASFALGAFLAGLFLSQADLSHRAADDLLPLRNAFAVLFFVSLGMLFDVQMLMTQMWIVLAVVGVIVLGNGVAVFLMSTLLRVPLEQRAGLGGGLAQIGEFSFLISGTALSLGLMSAASHALIIAGALIAIALNPIMRQLAGALNWWFERRLTVEATDTA